jgi:hypothetical protein
MKGVTEPGADGASSSKPGPDLLEQYGCGPLRFSGINVLSDRTIAEYSADIWNAKPCPVQ